MKAPHRPRHTQLTAETPRMPCRPNIISGCPVGIHKGWAEARNCKDPTGGTDQRQGREWGQKITLDPVGLQIWIMVVGCSKVLHSSFGASFAVCTTFWTAPGECRNSRCEGRRVAKQWICCFCGAAMPAFYLHDERKPFLVVCSAQLHFSHPPLVLALLGPHQPRVV